MNKNTEELLETSLNSESDMESEQQVIKTTVLSNKEDNKQSETQISKQVAEKRMRQESEGHFDDDDDEFITVRRNSKRLHRSFSNNNDTERRSTGDTQSRCDKYDVYITSKEILPKQIGMAKLLRAEKIFGISKVVYKNPFRVCVQFENRDNANKLLQCEKMKSLGYRCLSAQEVSLSYGIVKNIESDLKDEELNKIFDSEYDIISVKRLKRSTEPGKWEDSETVRLCFKSSTLPSFVEVYGCKLKVENYTFPVTQCSNCWKYGHLLRQCNVKKCICPKCGDSHANCETTIYKCVNCKGDHMSFNKTCPVFLKEKQIRHIMSSENCTYKYALDKYRRDSRLEKNILLHNNDNLMDDNETLINQVSHFESSQMQEEQTIDQTSKPSYRDIVLKKTTDKHRQDKSTTQTQKRNKKRNRKKNICKYHEF